MNRGKKKTGLFRANPTVPFNPTHQSSLTEFDLRFFLSTGLKVINFENLRIHYQVTCTSATTVRLFTRMNQNMMKKLILIHFFHY